MKYIFITGGVISCVGKGVVSGSIGVLLRANNYVIAHIKLDPYLNYSAEHMHPYEHGETFILQDGRPCDIDLGNYERLNNKNLSTSNALSSGIIIYEAISNELKGMLKGATLQFNPHIVEKIIECIINAGNEGVNIANGKSGKATQKPDVLLVELGGTVGDQESLVFTDAFAKFQTLVGPSNCFFISVNYLPTSIFGEYKEEPIIAADRNFREFGLKNDIIICRGTNELTEDFKNKISEKCWIKPENIIFLPYLNSIFNIPRFLDNFNIVDLIKLKFKLEERGKNDEIISNLEIINHNYPETITIGLIESYSLHYDVHASLIHALNFSGSNVGFNVDIVVINTNKIEENDEKALEKLKTMQGIIIPDGNINDGINGKLEVIKYARINDIPIFGISSGYHLLIIELFRNLLEIPDATSAEIKSDSKNIIIGHINNTAENIYDRGRVGSHEINISTDGIVKTAYGNLDQIAERHNHKFKPILCKVSKLNSHGVSFVGSSIDGNFLEILEFKNHPFFVGVQFRPEFKAKPNFPHPLINAFLQKARDRSK